MVKKPSHTDNGFFSRTPLYRGTQFLPGNDPIVSAQEMRWKTQVRTIQSGCELFTSRDRNDNATEDESVL